MKLIELQSKHIDEFKKYMQEAFQYGFESYTKQKEEQVLPDADIDNSLNDPNGRAYEMTDENGDILGGCIVNVNPETNINHLDFLFVRVGTQSKGIGQAIWKEIEGLYPKTKKWVTCTPYFDVRNIHFYVNKLKFHIVEFYNEHHPDPHMPDDFIGDGGEGMFEFEKVMEVK